MYYVPYRGVGIIFGSLTQEATNYDDDDNDNDDDDDDEDNQLFVQSNSSNLMSRLQSIP